MKTFKAVDIIPIYIKLCKQNSNVGTWNMINNEKEHSLLMLSQLESLLIAFGIKGGVSTLADGLLTRNMSDIETDKYLQNLESNEFIIDEFEELSSKVSMYSGDGVIKDDYFTGWRYFLKLAEIFEELKEMNHVTNGLFVEEYYADIVHKLCLSVNQVYIDKVYRFLGILIDPTEREIAISELVEKYKYPVKETRHS